MELLRQSRAHLDTAIGEPQRLLNSYGEFITKNASAVSQIESGLRSLTYIIPGRFREAEIASESLHSGVQLLSLYHDSLLAKALSRLPLASSRLHHASPHNRYTRFWTQKSKLYRRIALSVQMIQYTELLLEMLAKRRGDKVRWRVVVTIETVKAALRLFLLRLTNRRPLLSPPLPEREFDPAILEQNAEADPDLAYGANGTETQSQTPPSERSVETEWTMPRTGLTLPSLPDSHDISSYLLSKVLTADDIKPPKALLRRVAGKGEIAEILYILRPVIYALAMQRWSQSAEGKRSWRPWLIGFSIEYAAHQLQKRDFADRIVGGLRGLTALEKDEMRKRGWQMAWWGMRGAFYENITRSWIHGFTDRLKGKPILDMVAGIVEDYEFLWDEYYFPTATL